jgi:hypothetical protein
MTAPDLEAPAALRWDKDVPGRPPGHGGLNCGWSANQARPHHARARVMEG